MIRRTVRSAPSAAASILLAGALSAQAEDVDPFNDGSQYAYAENVGWMNAEPGGDGGPGMAIQDSFVSGWLWSANIGWLSLSCDNTASCANVKFGTRVAVLDESLQLLELDGYAWSENAGWISWSCRNTNSCQSVNYRVQLDAQTGMLNGYAWSANLGWIGFSCAASNSCAGVDFGVVVTEGLASDSLFADGFEAP